MRGALTVLLRNGLFFADGHFWENLCVRLETGRVTAMGEGLAPLAGEAVIDLQGDFVVPGFVDAHIHAFRGHDTMQGEDAIRQMARELYQEGVAAFLPTTMSASVEDTRRVIAAVRRVMDTPEQHAARVLGAHMEAPFLSPEKAGAQRKEFFLHPNWESFLDLTGGDIQAVRVITMAPELPGAEDFIRKAAENGIRVSIGHTAATDEQVHQAADWGATRVTHTYNAQTPFTHRAPGVPGAALTDDRLFAEFIGDGVHLHDDAVKVLLRCKGACKAVAITDSMEAAGLPDGEYALGGQAVTVRGHEARLHDGTLAGSVLLMRQAFQNLMARLSTEKNRWSLGKEALVVDSYGGASSYQFTVSTALTQNAEKPSFADVIVQNREPMTLLLVGMGCMVVLLLAAVLLLVRIHHRRKYDDK